MKHTITVFLILFTSSLSMFSQSFSNSTLNEARPVYDSVMNVLKQQDKDFLTKYNFVIDHDAMLDNSEILSAMKLLGIESQKESDREYVIKIYSQLYSDSYLLEKDLQKSKLYLDTAYTYIDQTKDDAALGLFYYSLGSYYRTNGDERLELEHFYKSILYLEKSNNLNKLLEVYNNITFAYIKKGDYLTAKKTLDKMDVLKTDLSEVKSGNLYYLYEAKQLYYSGLKLTVMPPLAEWDTLKYYTYLDSATYFLDRSIETCLSEISNTTRHDVLYKNLLTECYINLALEQSLKYTMHPDKEWNKVFDNLDKAEMNLAPMQYEGWINYYFTKGRVFAGLKKFQQANDEYVKALDILEEQPVVENANFHYLRIYKQLVVANVNINNLKDALVYQILYSHKQEEYYTAQRYKVVKDLEIQYQTAEKELEISHLNEEKQRTKFHTTLIIAVAAIFIVLFFIAFLYNRVQRLKKEKEASDLSVRIKEKDIEFQRAMAQSELDTMQSYLKGLEAERERLAKELHDNVANELLSIDFQLKEIEEVPEKTSLQLENLHNEIRNISHELMPPLFKYASLSEIILDYVSSITNKKDIEFEIDIQNECNLKKLPEKTALELYRIIQETVSNIIKHSEATKAKIVLNSDETELSLRIEDNGKGFDSSLKSQGIGLYIIKDRIKSLNGKLIMSTSAGCQLDIHVPL